MQSTTTNLEVPGAPCGASLLDCPTALVGECAGWFELRREDEAFIVTPRRPLPRRCTIRPAGMFDHDRGFTDVMTVMGRILFPRGASEPQRYVPFTRDPRRRLRELFLPVEVMPDDDWPMSRARWSNHQALAKRLLRVAGVPWTGLAAEAIERLTAFGSWAEPLEGCVLHALTRWTATRGHCVIEIGSFRGRSLAMLALALRDAESDAKVISIDPHTQWPQNAMHVRNALADWGEEARLVQFVGPSSAAHGIVRPGCASLVFIDGDHRREAVAADFQNYRALLAPGGCLAFHDYGFGPHTGGEEADPEVRPTVDELVFADTAFRPLLLAQTLMVFERRA